MLVFTKSTATWCRPCGVKGWTYFHDAIEKYKNDIVSIAIYDGNNGGLLSNQYAFVFNSYIFSPNNPAYPSFRVNIKTNAGSEMATGLLDNLVNIHNAKIFDIGMNFEAKIVDEGIQIIRYVQSKEAITDTSSYQLNLAILENNVQSLQNGLTGIQSHPFVLRYTSTVIQKFAKVYGKELKPAEALSGNLWADTVLVPNSEIPDVNKNNVKIAMLLVKDGEVINGYTRANSYEVFEEIITPQNLTINQLAETYLLGDKVEISWQTNNTTNKKLKIELLQENAVVQVIDSCDVSLNQYSWKIPSDQKLGDYSIKLSFDTLSSVSSRFEVSSTTSILESSNTLAAKKTMISISGSNLNLNLLNAGNTTVRITSLDGRILFENTANRVSGKNTIPITKSLSKGIYLVQVKNLTNVVTTKIRF